VTEEHIGVPRNLMDLVWIVSLIAVVIVAVVAMGASRER
jgi:hypothetical protein